MGRIQRKKTIKKKKKTGFDADVSTATNNGAALKTVSAQPKTAREQKAPAVRKSSTAVRTAPAKPKDNWLSKSIQFLREVKVELKKVTWPTRKQTVGSTIVVIILVMVIAFFLGAVDIGLSSLVKVVLQ